MLKSAARALLVAVAAIALVGTSVTSASAVGGGTISGSANYYLARVTLYNAATSQAIRTVEADSSGNFAFTGLAPGTYKIGFVGPSFSIGSDVRPPRTPEFWENASTLAEATVITITGSETVAINATLDPAPPDIAGTLIHNAGGAALWDSYPSSARQAFVYDVDGNLVGDAVARVGWGARYEIWQVPPGTYTVKIVLRFPSLSYADTYLGDTPFRSQATQVTVVAGETTAGPSVTLSAASTICGNFVDEVTHEPVDSWGNVQAWLLNSASGEYELFAETGTGYQHCSYGLWPGDYRLRFVPRSGSPFVAEWWEDSYYPDLATDITVGSRVNVTANFELGGIAAYRLGGVDRYDANVGMSYETFPPSGEPYSIPVLYVASGEKYPDALSAGPAAIANGGGLLLVRYGDIPAVTLEEIERLNPQRIVVVGGPASVSAAVYTQLAGLTDEIDRITGADRYEVSRNLIEQEFACDAAPCLTKVFVATGRNFPDALSAGPAAGHIGGAVLLIDGAQSTLDTPTLDLLEDMGVYRAYIAGGPASVTPEVQSHLNAVLDGPVIRFTGADRYEAAANINSTIFGDATTVFISTGLKFADALAGGPLAGAYDGPLYLAPGTCMPETVALSIIERNPAELVLLGGPASISEDVLYWLC